MVIDDLNEPLMLLDEKPLVYVSRNWSSYSVYDVEGASSTDFLVLYHNNLRLVELPYCMLMPSADSSTSSLEPVLSALFDLKRSLSSLASSIAAVPALLSGLESAMSDDIPDVDNFIKIRNFFLLCLSSPIDFKSLDGHFSKFVAGDIVFYGASGLWEVVSSHLSFTSDNELQPLYKLRQDTSANSSAPKYRYNTVPQSKLSLYVPPK